jgi:hypothetical protein
MLGMNTGSQTTHIVRIVRSHVDERLIVPGIHHIDTFKWDPLIMKFCEFFGGGVQLHPSRLAAAWQIPHTAPVAISAPAELTAPG